MAVQKEVLRAMHGNRESFHALIEANQEKLYRIAYSYVHNQHDALDIVQDAVYRAFVSIKNLKHAEYFNTWLVRIVINCALDKLRSAVN